MLRFAESFSGRLNVDGLDLGGVGEVFHERCHLLCALTWRFKIAGPAGSTAGFSNFFQPAPAQPTDGPFHLAFPLPASPACTRPRPTVHDVSRSFHLNNDSELQLCV